ncbi:hypothetical protein TIFTF001_016511 [Ficus carica]|uniref:Uncharacterized protein n=1 Tax=Ficus carica TaxID=3494 RepID=A0AA88A384_FICCA|nr:hypothetical protein TIFTF001_016511 [Ficus carica]
MVYNDPSWDKYPILVKGNWKSNLSFSVSPCFNSFDDDKALKLAHIPSERRKSLRSITKSSNLHFEKLFPSSVHIANTKPTIVRLYRQALTLVSNDPCYARRKIGKYILFMSEDERADIEDMRSQTESDHPGSSR